MSPYVALLAPIGANRELVAPQLGKSESPTKQHDGTMFSPTTLGVGVSSVHQGNIVFETGFNFSYNLNNDYESRGISYKNSSGYYWEISANPVIGNEHFVFRPGIFYRNYSASTFESKNERTGDFMVLDGEPSSFVLIGFQATAIISENVGISFSYIPTSFSSSFTYSDNTITNAKLNGEIETRGAVIELLIKDL